MEVAFLCQKLQLKTSSVSETCGSKVALEPETPKGTSTFVYSGLPNWENPFQHLQDREVHIQYFISYCIFRCGNISTLNRYKELYSQGHITFPSHFLTTSFLPKCHQLHLAHLPLIEPDRMVTWLFMGWITELNTCIGLKCPSVLK